MYIAVTHDEPDIIPNFALVSPNNVQPSNKLDTTPDQLTSALVVDELFLPD